MYFTFFDNQALTLLNIENVFYVFSMIGGEEFDQIKPFMGDGPGQGDGHDTTSDTATATTSSYDSMDAVRDVVNYLNIPSMECVTIIINYRLPRFEHWMSMYNKLNYKPSNTKAMETTIDTDDDGIDTIKSYEQHMCGETDMDKNMRIRELGTTMNPMYLATQFLHEGYNVKMIDMSGIDGDDPERKGQDISHTIACEILNGRCTELGWVKGHEEESIQNAVLHGKTQIEQQLIDDGEKLFQYRDCAYKYELERHAKFSIVDRTDIWKQCGPSTTDDSSSSNSGMAQIYNSLRRGVVLKKETIPKENGKGTETSIRFDNSNGIGSVEEGNQLLFEALLSQVECSARSSSDNPKKENKDKTNTEILVTMKGVLNGQYIDDIVTLASTKGGDKNKQVAALIEDEKTGTTVGSSNGGGDGDTSSFSWVWIVIGSLVGVFVLLFIRRRRGGDGSSGKYGRTTRQYEETEMTGRQQPQRSGRGGIRRSGGRQQKNQNGGRHNYNNTIPVESSFKDEASDSDDDSDDNDDDSSASSLEDIKIIPKSSLSSVSSLPPVSSSNQSPSPRSEQPSAKKAGVMQGLFSRFGRKDNITNSATAGRINNNARNIDDFIPNAGHPPFYSDDDNNHNNGYADDTYYNEEEDVICFDENNNDGDII